MPGSTAIFRSARAGGVAQGGRATGSHPPAAAQLARIAFDASNMASLRMACTARQAAGFAHRHYASEPWRRRAVPHAWLGKPPRTLGVPFRLGRTRHIAAAALCNGDGNGVRPRASRPGWAASVTPCPDLPCVLSARLRPRRRFAAALQASGVRDRAAGACTTPPSPPPSGRRRPTDLGVARHPRASPAACRRAAVLHPAPLPPAPSARQSAATGGGRGPRAPPFRPRPPPMLRDAPRPRQCLITPKGPTLA